MGDRPFNDIAYQQFLHEEKLMGSRCKRCGALFVPPHPICTACYGQEMQWVEMSGKGRLVAFTSIAVAPPFMMEEGYGRQNPYCSGVVQLEEGVRVVARIEGVDVSHPDRIRIGTPLRVEFLHRGEGENLRTFLAFSPL